MTSTNFVRNLVTLVACPTTVFQQPECQAQCQVKAIEKKNNQMNEELTAMSFQSLNKAKKFEIMSVLSHNEQILQNITERFRQKIDMLKTLQNELSTLKIKDDCSYDQGAHSQPLGSRPFKYSLQLQPHGMPQYLVKGRKFDLHVRMVDGSGQVVEHEKKLMLSCKLYRGNRQLHGAYSLRQIITFFPQSSIIRGHGRLIKAQVNIVSSKVGQHNLSLQVCVQQQKCLINDSTESIKAWQNLKVMSKNYKLQKEPSQKGSSS